jgi:curved DNA-binding protein CbpA
MSTYYDVLKVAPDATAAEVETAYETQYNHWRRLVTHHDPQMVNRANQALRWLEQVRETLMDAEKRAAYDAQLGLETGVHGLADLQAASQQVASLPSAPQPAKLAATSPSKEPSMSVWTCPKCQTRHPVGAMYCKKCGYQLGVACPKCHKPVLADAKFCPNCGVNVQDAIKEKEFEEAERQRRQREEARRQAQQQAAEEARAKALKRAKTRMAVVGGILGVIAAPIAWGIIWPDMMEMGFCAVGQMLLGAVGGVVTNLWAADSLVDPLKTEISTIVSIISGILGGIFAFPAIAIGLVIAIL